MSKSIIELEKEYVNARLHLNSLRAMLSARQFDVELYNLDNSLHRVLFTNLQSRIDAAESDLLTKMCNYIKGLSRDD